MFIRDAFAQTGLSASSGSLPEVLIQLGVIFLIFYMLLIRPQQKRIKQHEATLKAVKVGDKVLTGGGVYGTVTKLSSELELEVEIASGVKVVVNRATIREVLSEKPVAKAANSNKKTKK